MEKLIVMLVAMTIATGGSTVALMEILDKAHRDGAHMNLIQIVNTARTVGMAAELNGDRVTGGEALQMALDSLTQDPTLDRQPFILEGDTIKSVSGDACFQATLTAIDQPVTVSECAPVPLSAS